MPPLEQLQVSGPLATALLIAVGWLAKRLNAKDAELVALHAQWRSDLKEATKVTAEMMRILRS